MIAGSEMRNRKNEKRKQEKIGFNERGKQQVEDKNGEENNLGSNLSYHI